MNNSFFTFVVIFIIGAGVGFFSNSIFIKDSVATNESMDHMQVMMSDMSASLKGKSGDELDRAFLQEMIVHHEGAIQMAQELLRGTKRSELKKMGEDIISVQSKEISMMQSWLEEWFSVDGVR